MWHFCGHPQTCKAVKFLNCSTLGFLVEVKHCSSSCFGSHSVGECPFQGLFSSTLHIFVLFVIDVAAFKWPPSVVPKCCLAFLKCKNAIMCFYKENAFVGNELQSCWPWFQLTNQQCVWQKCIFTQTYTGYGLISSPKMCDQKLTGT